MVAYSDSQGRLSLQDERETAGLPPAGNTRSRQHGSGDLRSPAKHL